MVTQTTAGLCSVSKERERGSRGGRGKEEGEEWEGKKETVLYVSGICWSTCEVRRYNPNCRGMMLHWYRRRGKKEREEGGEKKKGNQYSMSLAFTGLHVKLVFIIQTVVWLCYVGIGGEETRKERKKWRETRQRKLYYMPPTVCHLLIYYRSGDPNSSRAG